MARIRSIKPEFFRHHRLYVAERETELPLRIAFAGLWTVCDREGRFRWQPEEIKLDCLPYDELDFARVLDALVTRGFVVRYTSGGRDYGWVPGFARHQVVNGREAGSKLPVPPETIDASGELTSETRVDDASITRHNLAQGEGKGREEEQGTGNREGKGREERASADAPSPAEPDLHEAVQLWNALADELDLVRAQTVNATRLKHLRARLAECGGIEGWRAALGRIRGSPFLLGQNERGWKADLDFVLQQKSFTRLMEGSYDRTRNTQPKLTNGFAQFISEGGFADVARSDLPGSDGPRPGVVERPMAAAGRPEG